MPATRELPLKLSVEQQKAILTLVARGPGALFDEVSLYSLATAGLIKVNDARRVVLTAAGKLAYASIMTRQ